MGKLFKPVAGFVLGVLLVLVAAMANTAVAANLGPRLDCVQGVAPDIATVKSKRDFRLIYLRTLSITEYETAKHEFGADYLGLFGASYSDYLERRKTYFEKTSLSVSDRTSLESYVQNVPLAARMRYFQCVETLAKTVGGVFVYFSDEDDTSATLHIVYKADANVPPQPIHAAATGIQLPLKLPLTIAANGSIEMPVARRGEQTMRVSVRVGRISDTAVSLTPAFVPIYESAYSALKEALVTTVRFGDFHAIEGQPVGCEDGGRCKTPNWVELRVPETPGTKIEFWDVSQAAASTSGHFYRCAVEVNCSTSEFTPSASKAMGVSCRGSSTCVAWRAADPKSDNSTQTYRVSYRIVSQVCTNCDRRGKAQKPRPSQPEDPVVALRQGT